MYYRRLVEAAYYECIALMPNIPHDLRVALKSHSRMPLFLSNLAQELDKLQTSRVGRGDAPMAVERLKSIVYDFTTVFVQGVKLQAEENYRSDVQKKLLEAQAQAQKDLDQTASGKVSGEYEELFEEGGITATSERSIT